MPTDQEVDEYAKWLGINMEEDKELLWIAREGLMAPLPKNWKPCKTKDTDDIYYFNFDTGESTWDHPCDGYYKRIYEEEKKKLETQKSKSSDLVRSRAKQDVDTLLGKTESKKKKSKESDKTLLSPPKKLLSVPSIGLKAIKSAPLPDIRVSSPSPFPSYFFEYFTTISVRRSPPTSKTEAIMRFPLRVSSHLRCSPHELSAFACVTTMLCVETGHPQEGDG